MKPGNAGGGKNLTAEWDTLRNKLAHRIEPTDTKQLLGRIVYWVPDRKRELETEDAQNALSVVIGMLIARLGELEGGRIWVDGTSFEWGHANEA